METISISDKITDIKSVISDKAKEGLTIKEIHTNLDGSNVLTFYDSTKEDIREPFEVWVDACPDEKIKNWINKGREFFK